MSTEAWDITPNQQQTMDNNSNNNNGRITNAPKRRKIELDDQAELVESFTPHRTARELFPSSDLERAMFEGRQKEIELLSKPNARKLSKNKFAYCREGEKEVNLIIRDIKEDIKFPVFGVRGKDIVDFIFYSTLAILDAHKEDFAAQNQFGGEKLYSLLQRIPPDDREQMHKLIDSDGSIFQRSSTSAEYVPNSPPQILLKTERITGETESRVFRTYLYMWEAMKLVKNLSAKMQIGNSALSDTFKLHQYTHDDADLFWINDWTYVISLRLFVCLK